MHVPPLASSLLAALLAASPGAGPAGLVAAVAEPAATDATDGGRAAGGVRSGPEAPRGGDAAPAPPDEEEGPHPGWFYGTLAAAAVFGIAGATTGGMALGERDEYSAALAACRGGDASACRVGPSIVDDYELYATLTNVLLPCAGAFALAALVLAFLTDFGGDNAASDDGDTYFTFFGASAGLGATLAIRF